MSCISGVDPLIIFDPPILRLSDQNRLTFPPIPPPTINVMIGEMQLEAIIYFCTFFAYYGEFPKMATCIRQPLVTFNKLITHQSEMFVIGC